MAGEPLTSLTFWVTQFISALIFDYKAATIILNSYSWLPVVKTCLTLVVLIIGQWDKANTMESMYEYNYHFCELSVSCLVDLWSIGTLQNTSCLVAVIRAFCSSSDYTKNALTFERYFGVFFGNTCITGKTPMALWHFSNTKYM